MKRLITLLCCIGLLWPVYHTRAASQMLPLPANHGMGIYMSGDSQTLYLLTIENFLFRFDGQSEALEPVETSSAPDASGTVTGLVLIGDGLYTSNRQSHTLRLLHARQGTPAVQIELPIQRDVRNTGKSTSPTRMVYREDQLWFLLDRLGNDNHVLCRYDLKTGKIKAFEESKGVEYYCPLPDGRVLLCTHRYERGVAFSRLTMLDTNRGRVSKLFDTNDIATSLAFDEDQGVVYYNAGHTLWRWPVQGEPEQLVELPVQDPGHNAGQLFQGRLAVHFDGGLYLSDPTQLSRGQITVVGDSSYNYYTKGYVRFMQQHPDIAIQGIQTAANKENFGTGDLAQRIRTGDLVYDVMHASTHQYDLDLLIEKGYCAQLQDDPELKELVESMHPAIHAKVTRDGKIYALPVSIHGMNSLSIEESGFALAGLDRATLPQSLEGLIRLAGGWRSQHGGEDALRPFNVTDAAGLLKQLAISRYVHDLQSRGQPLSFSGPAFQGLLRLIEGQRLRPFPDQTPYAFQSGSGELLSKKAMIFSLFEGGPALQPAWMYYYFINAKSGQQELARLYLRSAAQALTDKSSAYLFPNWQQPVEKDDYVAWLKTWQAEEATLQQRANDASQSELAKRTAQDLLDVHRAQFQEQEALRRYEVSPEDLTHYQEQVVPALFFPMPSVFTDWSQPGAVLLDKEIKRYLDGHLSAEQLAQSLDQMARLMELEQR